MQEGGLTVGQGLHDILMLIGSAAFNWIPATVFSIVPTAESYQSVTPITSPMTASDAIAFFEHTSTPSLNDHFFSNWGIFVVFSMFISLIFLSLLIYCVTRIFQVRDFEQTRFAAAEHPIAARDIPKAQLRWNRVVEQVNSDNEQNWRLAILEADIMLNDLLDSLGYRGETMGDKMKNVDRADFNTIDLAWEAHRARNDVAHKGSSHAINAREARRIINLYERVFREFRFVE